MEIPHLGDLEGYWCQATEEQRAHYLEMLEGLCVKSYARRFAEYPDVQVRVDTEFCSISPVLSRAPNVAFGSKAVIRWLHLIGLLSGP